MGLCVFQVEEFRARDAASGLKIAQALEGFISRKVVKQTVMTVVYGVTRYGGRLQIEKRLKEIDEFPKVQQQWRVVDRSFPRPAHCFIFSVVSDRVAFWYRISSIWASPYTFRLYILILRLEGLIMKYKVFSTQVYHPCTLLLHCHMCMGAFITQMTVTVQFEHI